MELWTKSVKLARLHCGKGYCKYNCRGSEKYDVRSYLTSPLIHLSYVD